ncbi:MAG: AEC family transporter [Limisphaerales bacterium]
MNSSGTVLSAVIPVFAILGIGLAVRRLNWLTAEADRSLFRVVINVLMPCLILDTSLGNAALADWRNVALAPLVGAVTVFAGVALAWLLACRWPGLSAGSRRTFAVTAGLYNYGYVPLPLVLLLFDQGTAGVLFLHNLGVELLIWTGLLWFLTGGHGGRGWRNFLNAPLVAIVLALGLNFAGLDGHLPGALRNVLHLLGLCAFPLALMLVGATIADHLEDLRTGGGWGVVLAGTVLRLALLPLGFLALARWLPAPVELQRVVVVEAAMPCAVLPIVLARHYGGDPGLALRLVLVTSGVSLVTTPLWLQFGLRWAGVN